MPPDSGKERPAVPRPARRISAGRASRAVTHGRPRFERPLPRAGRQDTAFRRNRGYERRPRRSRTMIKNLHTFGGKGGRWLGDAGCAGPFGAVVRSGGPARAFLRTNPIPPPADPPARFPERTQFRPGVGRLFRPVARSRTRIPPATSGRASGQSAGSVTRRCTELGLDPPYLTCAVNRPTRSNRHRRRR